MSLSSLVDNHELSEQTIKKLRNDTAAEIDEMSAFIALLMNDELVAAFCSNDTVFHDVLSEVRRRCYCHFTRLTLVISMKDSTTVSRWYTAKTAPDMYKRPFIIRGLVLVMQNDIARLERGDLKIGYMSMKQHSELEVVPVV